MPTIDKTYDIAAEGSGTIDVLEGSQYQYLPYNAKIDIGFKLAAALSSGPTVNADAFCGSDLLQQDGSVPPGDSLTLQFPYDFLLTDYGAQGERVGVTVRWTAKASGGTTGRLRVVVKLAWL